MPVTITVEYGDCLINLSYQKGFFWETIWNHPQNASLRQVRKHHNIIKEGDEVFFPDLEAKQLQRPTDQLHRFVRKGATAQFSLTLMEMGQPRANERYVLVVNGRSREGTTDANGKLTEPIPPDARDGFLLLGEKQEKFAIDFGWIDPIEAVSGVKSRLYNLGLYEGEIDDELTPETSTAIAEFQRSAHLPGEGELTDETKKALVAAHGS
jgi:N-acetylmuramoyl-L-alanine amidase